LKQSPSSSVLPRHCLTRDMTIKKAFTTATVYETAQPRNHEAARSCDDWTPGFWINFPRAGSLSIIGILLCMTGSVLVLAFSDDTPEQRWTPRQVTPSVWLSGFNNIANICFGVAIGKVGLLCVDS
jgi:hypothetical protein